MLGLLHVIHVWSDMFWLIENIQLVSSSIYMTLTIHITMHYGANTDAELSDVWLLYVSFMIIITEIHDYSDGSGAREHKIYRRLS
jgi:hypothetical protein